MVEASGRYLKITCMVRDPCLSVLCPASARFYRLVVMHGTITGESDSDRTTVRLHAGRCGIFFLQTY